MHLKLYNFWCKHKKKKKETISLPYSTRILLASVLSLFLILCIDIDVIKTKNKNKKYITIYNEIRVKGTTIDTKSIKVYSSKRIKNVKTIKIDKNSGRVLLEITMEK